MALAEGEQRGHFKNHLRHFCARGALSLLVLLKMPGDGQRSGSQTQESGAGTCSEESGQAQAGDGGLQSRSAMLLAGWGLGGHDLLCALHKPEFPTREDVYEEQETLNPIRREK